MMFPWHQNNWTELMQRRERLPHALLLQGPEGIGKLAFAEALAQALLCETPSATGASCGRCPSCGWMERGSHPDYRRLEPESLAGDNDSEEGSDRKASVWIPVEAVRGLADFIHISSHRGGARVVLIHPAEALNPNAANALLKNLEEPPPRTFFVLVSHRWHRLLPTVKSRCQSIALPPPSFEAARDWLAQQGLENPGLALAQAGGAPLLATRFDEEYWRERNRFLQAITDSGFDALNAAEQMRDLAPGLMVSWLQRWSFDLASQMATGAVRYNPDRKEAIIRLTGRLDFPATLRFHRQMVRLQRIVSHPLNARLFIEELMLGYGALLSRRAPGLAA